MGWSAAFNRIGRVISVNEEDVRGQLRGRCLRPVLCQRAGSDPGRARLAERRRSELSVDGQRGGVCAGPLALLP